MPRRQDIIPGAPCWLDLMTTNKQQAMAFYGELFGWTEQESGEEYGFYSTVLKGDDAVAGMMEKTDDMPDMPDVWSVYFAVEDTAATIGKATAAGGQVMLDAMPVGDLGVMGMVGDPTGAAIGLWQPQQHRGFLLWGETGAPCWFELRTRDVDAASAFYANVFGNTVTPQDTGAGGPDYATLDINGESQAGIMGMNGFIPDEVPPHWVIYFGVDDCEAAVQKVEELGGSIIASPQGSPYGTVATVTDPMGATFIILSR